jgi:hypothetical protein
MKIITRPLYNSERKPAIHLIGGWVGPNIDLEYFGKENIS